MEEVYEEAVFAVTGTALQRELASVWDGICGFFFLPQKQNLIYLMHIFSLSSSVSAVKWNLIFEHDKYFCQHYRYYHLFIFIQRLVVLFLFYEFTDNIGCCFKLGANVFQCIHSLQNFSWFVEGFGGNIWIAGEARGFSQAPPDGAINGTLLIVEEVKKNCTCLQSDVLFRYHRAKGVLTRNMFSRI